MKKASRNRVFPRHDDDGGADEDGHESADQCSDKDGGTDEVDILESRYAGARKHLHRDVGSDSEDEEMVEREEYPHEHGGLLRSTLRSRGTYSCPTRGRAASSRLSSGAEGNNPAGSNQDTGPDDEKLVESDQSSDEKDSSTIFTGSRIVIAKIMMERTCRTHSSSAQHSAASTGQQISSPGSKQHTCFADAEGYVEWGLDPDPTTRALRNLTGILNGERRDGSVHNRF
ncbi:hypothetical protein MVEN_00226800 [Mycena venus]|uniref:Uncharacterized protein n=1 Tax=Mycena venus TaxID=2733690 RepID=A0A8H6Z251_9AGAR|nr:hypothetical protein MVEN_00226800 [Mycena venus]